MRLTTLSALVVILSTTPAVAQTTLAASSVMTVSVDGRSMGRITNVTTLMQELPKTSTVGTTTSSRITFTVRTSLANPLKTWHDNVVSGTATTAKRTMTLTVIDKTGAPVVAYALANAWPAKVALVSRTTDAIIENVAVEYEGLEIKQPSR